MLDESHERLKDLFTSDHIIGNPFFNKKTHNWHIKLSNGLRFRTQDLLLIQTWVDFLNGEEVEWD